MPVRTKRRIRTFANLSPPSQARVAFMRFGLGPKPGNAARLAATDGAAYEACLREIENPKALLIPDEEVRAHCTDTNTEVPLTYANCCRFGAVLRPFSTTQFRPQASDIVVVERAARFAKALEPEVGFAERLVHFWSNHFSIYSSKSLMVQATVGQMERGVIRRRVFGKFSDLLRDVYTHPTMICYLENQRSMGENSAYGKPRKLSYNENLAREILELHTLGAYGGYTQQDVTSFAKVLTGWTIYPSNHPQAGQFYFEPSFHEPGSQTVLGTTYGQTGIDQGLAILDALAAHPSTAQHIAFKLIHHFISEEPPLGAVQALANVFTLSGGDLQAVSKALLLMSEAWSGQMTRPIQPLPWQASILRALGFSKELAVSKQVDLHYWIAMLSQTPWGRMTPDGYPDESYFWTNTDSVRIRKDVAFVFINILTKAGLPLPAATTLAPALLPGTSCSPSLASGLAALKTARIPENYALAMLFTSPEYMLR